MSEKYFDQLMTAIYRMETTKIANLVKEVDNLNSIDEHGFSLLNTCLFKDYNEACEILLENGADPNLKSTNKKWFAPLHTAASKGNLIAAKLLVEYGAEIDIQDAFGNTPLAKAVWERKKDMAKFLLEKGADPCKENFYGKAPKDLGSKWESISK